MDQETFDNVQRIRSNVRRYPDGWREAHPLTGLMYCADCGAKMYVHRVNNGKRVPQYTCSAYSKIPVGTLCPTQHRINADVVMELIKELLKAIAEYSQLNREEFIETVRKAQTSQQSSEITRLKSRLSEAQKRVQDLEKLLCRIYEDNILGKLPDERYAVLDGQYSKEQKELSAEIAEIEAAHSQRFRKIADSLENNTFYMCENADGTKKWICTNCGHIHEGNEAPALCPVCKHPQGYFLPCFLDLHIGF